MTASHPQYFIVIDSISPHSNSQLLTAIHCDEPNTGFEPRLISAHFFARWSGWRLHTIVDGLGNPVEFLISAGNDADSKHAIDLLKKVDITKSNILGDKAYGSKEIRSYITENGESYTIPPKSNTKEPWACDYYLYKERHLVECFF